MSNQIFRQTIGGNARFMTYAISLLVTIFLTIYNQIVCPFLASLSFWEELRNLIVANVIMLIFRELLYWVFQKTREGSTVARHAYILNVLSWVFAGLLSVGIHIKLYGLSMGHLSIGNADFPWHSALKILSGYWIMGACLIAQLEYVIYERKMRAQYSSDQQGKTFLEHIAYRLTESTALFVLTPVMAMIVMIIRYVFQDGIIPPNVAIELMYLGVVFLAVAISITIIYGRGLRKDAHNIVNALSHVEKGNFNIEMDTTRTDELGAMAYGINEMAKGLRQREKIREAFGRFVDPTIAQAFIDKHADESGDVRIHGEKKNVAVLLCDIRGFTSMSEQMDPSRVTAMLNRYFACMVEIIQGEGGIIDKFIGDAVMAIFGIVGEDNFSLKAVKTAYKMNKSLETLNAELKKDGFKPIKIGIGVHYGTVVAGYLGSQERLEYTVIGSTVNQAARLCDVARSPQPPVVFSQAVCSQIKDSIKTAPVATVTLKGIGETAVYSFESWTQTPI